MFSTKFLCLSALTLCVGALALPACAAEPVAPTVLQTFASFQITPAQLQAQLKTQHPRILLTPARLEELKRKIKVAPWAKTLESDLYQKEP